MIPPLQLNAHKHLTHHSLQWIILVSQLMAHVPSEDLGLRRTFCWAFVIADVGRPILGADFLHHFNLLVDLTNSQLLDNVTQLHIQSLIFLVTMSVSKASHLLNIHSISEFPQPTSQRQLCQFIGLVSFYRCFIPHCASLMHLSTNYCFILRTRPAQ